MQFSREVFLEIYRQIFAYAKFRDILLSKKCSRTIIYIVYDRGFVNLVAHAAFLVSTNYESLFKSL